MVCFSGAKYILFVLLDKPAKTESEKASDSRYVC